MKNYKAATGAFLPADVLDDPQFSLQASHVQQGFLIQDRFLFLEQPRLLYIRGSAFFSIYFFVLLHQSTCIGMAWTSALTFSIHLRMYKHKLFLYQLIPVHICNI